MRGPNSLTFPVTTLFVLTVFLSLGDFCAFFVSFYDLLFLFINSWLFLEGLVLAQLIFYPSKLRSLPSFFINHFFLTFHLPSFRFQDIFFFPLVPAAIFRFAFLPPPAQHFPLLQPNEGVTGSPCLQVAVILPEP